MYQLRRDFEEPWAPNELEGYLLEQKQRHQEREAGDRNRALTCLAILGAIAAAACFWPR